MFLLAAAACCMPSQDEALNDLSSMPPVSVTMQPRNLVAEVPPVLDDDGDVADPHAVSTTSALAATAAVINFFNDYLP